MIELERVQVASGGVNVTDDRPQMNTDETQIDTDQRWTGVDRA